MSEPPIRRFPLPTGGFITGLRDDIFRRAVAAAGASLAASNATNADMETEMGILDDMAQAAGADDQETETGVLRALSGAVDDLLAAKQATRNGLLSDHIDNGLREIRHAMRLAIGSDEHPSTQP